MKLTPELCERHAVGSELRADKHAEDARRSLALAEECRTEAATWRARAEALKSRPSEPTAAPDVSPPLGAAAVDSAGSAATEEPCS